MADKGLKYVDRQYIGGGRYSEVYKAKESETGQLVALKVTNPDEDGPPHNSRNELKLLQRLAGKSRNIASLLDYYYADQFDLVMVLPFYAFTLGQYVFHNARRTTNPYLLAGARPKPRNNLSTEKSDAILKGIAAGLHFLHSQGVIHRDVKPENIMFQNFEPVPLLIDLGISYEYPDNSGREDPQKKITQVASSIYKAPELLFGISDYSFGVDIWSFGVVMTLIYSDNCEPALDKEDAYADLRLVSMMFKVFGTPTTETWPEAAKSVTFSRLNFTQTDPLPLDKVIPRADERVKDIFKRIMIYESTKRLTAYEIYELLA